MAVEKKIQIEEPRVEKLKSKPEKKTNHHQHQRLSKISFILLIISRHCATENVVSAAANHTLRLLVPVVGPAPLLSLQTRITPYICINIYSLWMAVGQREGRGVSR